MATQIKPHVRTMLPDAAHQVQGRRAGVVTRTIVMLIDALVVAGSLGVGYLAWAAARFTFRPRVFSWPTVSFGTALVGAGVICVVYLTISWATTGRSVGKRFFGLRVVGGAGQRLRLVRAFARAVACTCLPVLLWWAAISKENRSVQDQVLRTSVIYDWMSSSRRRPGDVRGGAASAVPGEGLGSGEDPGGPRVDVAAAVADEADDRHPEPLPRLDGE
ncbi:MAG: RDD family protein [Actinomycetota bacterium]